MQSAESTEHMTPAEKKFARQEIQYFKKDYVSRLPSVSYQRMARELFVYPEEMQRVDTP